MRSRLRNMLDRPQAEGASGPNMADAALVAVAAGVAVLEGTLRPDLEWPVTTTLVTVALILTLPWRRTYPLAVVATTVVVSAAFGIAQAVGGTAQQGLVAMFAVILAPYALFRWGSGRDRAVGGGLLVLGLALSVSLGGEGIAGAIAGAAFVGGASMIGALRRERVVSTARMLDAVRSAEREALARDLHDTVAHHVSAIAIRAQVASSAPDDVTRVSESLGVIEREAQAVLTDMRSLVRALRAPADFAPVPGLSELEALAAPGPPTVTVRVDAHAAIPDLIASSLFRIAQESVTNARRHATGATSIVVTLSVDADAASIVVQNDGAASRPASGDGHGLRGLAERVALLGGEVTAGPQPQGGWIVRARLPIGRRA